MNIFEEIAESYTYNGAISIKALEDDIVTLENQLDSYNATLRELQLRGKKPGMLIEKIRDAKMRLSLLRAVLRREKDKASPDDIIKNMLGISANEAKETTSPETAAGNKAPVQQNFEKAEIEVLNEDGDSTAVEEEPLTNSEVTVESLQCDDSNSVDVVVERDGQNDIVSNTKIETDGESDTEITEEINKKDEEYKAVSNKDDIVVEHSIVRPETASDKESDIVTLNNTPEKATTEYFIPKNEKNKEDDKKAIEMEKFKVSDEVYDLTKATKEELDEFCATLTSDDTVFVLKDGENVEPENEPPVTDCPPPTIDDYTEPVDEQESVTYYDENGEECTEIPPCYDDNVTEYDTISLNDAPNITDKNVITYETDVSNEFNVYDAFKEDKTELVASVDLSYVTDMVNTMRVYAQIDHNRRLLNIRFVDVRDYEVFVKLLKEREEERHNPFKLLFKKPKSIFIYMTASVGDLSKKYKFEFTRCRIKNVFDSEYISKVGIPSKDSSYHDCGVTFKYKKLIIS